MPVLSRKRKRIWSKWWPVSDKLVHSINEIFFLVGHIYELPFNTANLCQKYRNRGKREQLITRSCEGFRIWQAKDTQSIQSTNMKQKEGKDLATFRATLVLLSAASIHCCCCVGYIELKQKEEEGIINSFWNKELGFYFF